MRLTWRRVLAVAVVLLLAGAIWFVGIAMLQGTGGPRY
jgi:hypothetical protein